jgi:hypothetical protein
MITTCVDDCLCIGGEEDLKTLVKEIKATGYKIKVEENVEDYLSCHIVTNKARTKLWLGQPHIIKNIIDKFGKQLSKMQSYTTPGTPNVGVIRPNEGDQRVESNEHRQYRSGVGMLLYLVKHSRPDIANAVRELSKVLDGPTPAAFKEMKRVMKFVMDTKNYGLKIEPLIEGKEIAWTMQMYSDSEFAGDKNNRISVGGYVLFLMGAPILWRSKAQRSVTLSSSEAEYVAMSEAAKEVIFVTFLLQDIGIKVKMPVIVFVDNVGAIYMGNNASTSARTRHVDTRYHFVREFIVEGRILVKFVRSEQNLSDGFTKNVKGEIYENHKSSMIAERERIRNS